MLRKLLWIAINVQYLCVDQKVLTLLNSANPQTIAHPVGTRCSMYAYEIIHYSDISFLISYSISCCKNLMMNICVMVIFNQNNLSMLGQLETLQLDIKSSQLTHLVRKILFTNLHIF